MIREHAQQIGLREVPPQLAGDAVARQRRAQADHGEPGVGDGRAIAFILELPHELVVRAQSFAARTISSRLPNTAGRSESGWRSFWT